MLIDEIIKKYIVVENDNPYTIAQKVYEEENNKEENKDIQLEDLGNVGDLWMSIAICNKEGVKNIHFDENETKYYADACVGNELTIYNFRLAVAIMNAIRAELGEIGPETLTEVFPNLYPYIEGEEVTLINSSYFAEFSLPYEYDLTKVNE